MRSRKSIGYPYIYELSEHSTFILQHKQNKKNTLRYSVKIRKFTVSHIVHCTDDRALEACAGAAPSPALLLEMQATNQ